MLRLRDHACILHALLLQRIVHHTADHIGGAGRMLRPTRWELVCLLCGPGFYRPLHLPKLACMALVANLQGHLH